MEKSVVKSVRFEPGAARLFEEKARDRNLSFSDAVRAALAVFFGLDTDSNPYCADMARLMTLVDSRAEYQAGEQG